MTVRTRVVLAAIALTLIRSATAVPPASAHPTESSFMFPRLVLIRGGALREPAILTHGSDFTRGPIAIVYSSLTPVATVDPLTLAGEPRYEVAEFYGTRSRAEEVFSRDGQTSTPMFAGANHFSRLYAATSKHPVIWENPVVRPGGSRARYFTLSDSASRILTRVGVALK